MTIKDGYNGEPLFINIHKEAFKDVINVQIEQFDEYKSDKLGVENARNTTLAYMTLNEAIELRDSLNVAIKETAGV